ncbi:MAG: hypothetical protein Q9214_007862, partial [Letrouitia sp. 1 TL-2023]
VTGLLPYDTPEAPYFYTFKVQCTSCREIHPNWVSLSRFRIFSLILVRSQMKYQEVEVKQISYGDAKFAKKRESTASIKDAPRAYQQSSPPTTQNIVELDCRGLEFTEFRADGEWLAKGQESSSNFSSIDLQEGEWYDYDEKAGDE